MNKPQVKRPEGYNAEDHINSLQETITRRTDMMRKFLRKATMLEGILEKMMVDRSPENVQQVLSEYHKIWFKAKYSKSYRVGELVDQKLGGPTRDQLIKKHNQDIAETMLKLEIQFEKATGK